MKVFTEFPTKHIEGNLAFGRDGSVWAYYQVEGYGYDFRDYVQKIHPYNNQLSYYVENMSDLHFLMIPSLTDVNGILDETIEDIKRKDYPLKENGIDYFERLKQTLSNQRASRETNEYHTYIGVQLDPKKNEFRKVGNTGLALVAGLSDFINGFKSPVYRAMGLEPNDILKVDIEQFKHQAEGLRETLSQSMSSLVRMLSKEETLFLIEQNFSVTPNDTKLRKGYETSIDVFGIDGERKEHEARRGRAQSFYELQNAEIEEYDQKTLKLYKMVDEEIKESYVQYLVADKMTPHSLHPGSEWMFHIQNRLRFPVAVSVKAGLLRNDQIIKNLSNVRLSYEDQRQEAQKGDSSIDLNTEKAESGAIQMESRFTDTGYPAYGCSFVFRVSAKDKDQLRVRVDELKREMQAFGIHLLSPYGEMIAYFMEFIPTSPRINSDYIQYVEPTKLAGMMFGATTNIGDNRGFYIGQTLKLNRPVFIQPDLAAKAYEGVNNVVDSLAMMIAGMTGKGKSFWANLYTYLCVLTGSRALIIDPKGDRKGWAEGLPFIPPEFISVWTLGADKRDAGCLDPFRTSVSIQEAKDISLDILSFLCDLNLGDPGFTRLSEAVEHEGDQHDPCLGGVLHYFKGQLDIADMSERNREAVQGIVETLETLKRTQIAGLLFGEKGQDYRVLEVTKPLQVLMVQNLKLPRGNKAPRPIEKISEAILISITSFTKQYMLEQDRSIHKVILQDESKTIENSSEGKNQMDFIVRMGRHYNTTLVKGTQNATDYDEDVSNMGMKFCFALKKIEEAEEMLRYFGLPVTPSNLEYLNSLDRGTALFQDIYGRTAAVRIHPVYKEIEEAFDSSTATQEDRAYERERQEKIRMGV
ncbi:ATP-binding protein [Paenibacillus sp. GYB006]|uniref:ATP-binding protein n=1 Tax=Paenibacillus sp. GYB006 TaxID=2994394 RepID=UPI002F967F18